MSKKSKITAEQIESSLANFCQQLTQPKVDLDVVPPGWFTVTELAAELNKANVTVSQRVRKLVKTGQAERQDFTIQLEQVARKVPHYRLKKG
jgi:predicted transcriptional regulator